MWNNEFQFQYGSIKRGTDSLMLIDYSNFNSNMVRLKVRSGDMSKGRKYISIPIWFD